MSKHTHLGHCQACGRQQAVRNGKQVIALHGYTVDGGYFSGTCAGSKHAPLELERDLLDSIVVNCHKDADNNAAWETRARDAVAALPENLLSLSKVETGHVIYKQAPNGRRYSEPELIAWDDARPDQRKAELTGLVFSYGQRSKFMRDHARMLGELAAKVHGQPLQPVPPEPVRPQPKAGDVFERYGSQWTVLRAVDIRVGFNGRYQLGWRCRREHDQKTFDLRNREVVEALERK